MIPSLLLAGGALLCSTRWQAWFGMPEEPAWIQDTLDYVFPSITNQPSPITNDNDSCLTILVLGDIHSNLIAADYDTLAARVPHTDLVLQTGDWLDRGQEYYRQLLLHEWTAGALYGTPVITCPGNHEYTKGWNKTLSPVWAQTFGIPSDANRLLNVPGLSYYVDIPQIRFIVMDTNPLGRLVWLTRTLTWLRKAIDTADGRYIVVLMHHPVLSPAKGRFNPLIYATFRYTIGDADLVLAGHDHSYMRRSPFVVLNTSGKPKEQRIRLFTPEVTETVPVYGVITVNERERSNSESGLTSNSPKNDLIFRIFSLESGELLDSVYVDHH